MTSKPMGQNDNGGKEFLLDEIEVLLKIDFEKIFDEIKDSKQIQILTYSMYDTNFIHKLIDKVSNKKNLKIGLSVDNKCSNFYKKYINDNFKDVEVKLVKSTHAKMILAEPNFVYLGSQNIEQSDWFQVGVIIRDENIYRFCKKIYEEKLKDDRKCNNVTVKNSEYIEGTKIEKNLKKYTPLNESIRLKKVQIKISTDFSWNQKTNGHKEKNISIVTYTLPNVEYVRKMLKKLFDKENNVKIYANEIARNTLEKLKETFTDLEFECYPSIHAKLILINKKTVWISSQNFGTSSWFENTVRIKDERLYNFLMEELENYTKNYKDQSNNLI